MPDIRADYTLPDYRTFELAGDHYACGWAMGQVTELRVIQRRANQSLAREFAEACAEVVRREHAPLLREYRGYAEAQGRPWEDVLPHFSLHHPAGVVGGCSTLVWRSEDGHVMVARNYDFTTDQRARHLIRSAPPGVQPVLGANASLIGGRYDGVNGAGLFVSLHLVRTDEPARVGPAVPFHLAPRIVLESCATAHQARQRLMSMLLMHSFNYVVADAREFFAVEVHPTLRRAREGDGALVTTNHYQHADMQPFHGRRQGANSRRRAERLWELWAGRHGDPWAWGQRALAEHDGPICGHDRHLATLWSLVADLSARRIAYCLGAPCETPFVEMPWPARA